MTNLNSSNGYEPHPSRPSVRTKSSFLMICYIGIGWCIVFAIDTLIASMELAGLVLLLAGGIAYTVGAVLYGIGKKRAWMHGIFHLFVLLGSVLHFLCIFFYVIL